MAMARTFTCIAWIYMVKRVYGEVIMILLRKWNFNTHEYETFESPAKELALYKEYMKAQIDCANCGKRMVYGESYTSRTIHNSIGLGYPVCDDCYQEEWKAEKESKNEKSI
jgi:hypothetical protein